MYAIMQPQSSRKSPRLLRQLRLRAISGECNRETQGQFLQTESVVTNGGDEMFHAPPEGYVCAGLSLNRFARLIRRFAAGRPDPNEAVAKIETYYQQLMPTMQQAARLNVVERDRRFTPVFTAVFDIPTMTRLAVGPSWRDFSAQQQAAVTGRLCPLHRCGLRESDQGLFRRTFRR